MTEPTRKQSGADRGDATRLRIVAAARALVAERGYEQVNMAEVLERAGVSRGGLYHHFTGKQELMAAVLESFERDMMAQLAGVVADAPDPLAAITVGINWYLDECISSRELQRIGLLEGRRALGWKLWQETIAPYGLAMLAATLDATMDADLIERVDPTSLAHLILAALHEASAMIDAAEDSAAARADAGRALALLIGGLKTDAARLADA
jgi:AcrR family transcriptional regulator